MGMCCWYGPAKGAMMYGLVLRLLRIGPEHEPRAPFTVDNISLVDKYLYSYYSNIYVIYDRRTHSPQITALF